MSKYINSLNQGYQGLLAEVYDLVFQLPDDEYNFYRYFLDSMPGPALELASGSGQFLLNYLIAGYAVEGVDCSSIMLEQCLRKALGYKVKPVLYNQSMQDLALSNRYKTIFIPSCSFMLISDYAQAEEALKRFYEHLAPGGQLIISLFLPWYERELLANVLRLRESNIALSENISVAWYESFAYDPVEQIRQAFYRFEKYKNNVLEYAEQHAMEWRWYGRYEFEALLGKAGFEGIRAYGEYTLCEPSASTSTLCFRALRPL